MIKSQKRWLTKTKLIVGGVIIAVIVLGIGLGVGLGVGLNQGGGDDNAASSTTPALSTPTINPTTNSTSIWQPAVGDTWNYVLSVTINSTDPQGIHVWDIDLFNNNATIIRGLQSQGAKVICYFSAGSWENWRPDAANFSSADLGNTLDGWPNEKWLNTSSQNVRNIMLKRLDMAVQKGCNGVDPDNVDGYDNKNGLGLTEEDAIDYMSFLAQAARSRNLAIGLKNAGAIIPNVIGFMQWSVNEQCEQYKECATYAPFIQQEKPVFHVEYPKGANTNNNNDVSASVKTSICDDPSAAGFSTIIKNINLDSWTETC